MVSAHSASGSNPTATRSPIPARAPLTLDVAAAIAKAWTHGCYADLADAAIDVVAEHVRTHGIAAMDGRLAGAFADVISARVDADLVVELDAPHDATTDAAYDPQLTLADALRGAVDPRGRVVAHTFPDGTFAVRPIGGAR